ncbi:flagellin [Rhizobiales bacterium GAS191]|nr:flagellin [Rhizobiales bacterium GAS113]SEE94663.1 flagellin [Rhizobiales bacterium GAS191]
MSSILTNMSAMTALQALSQTQKALTQTQTQISSGLRVASAEDNAAYWSIATTMRSDKDALSSVQDSLSLGGSTVGVANAAMNSTISVMDKIKSDLVTAAEPGVDRSKIQTDISALQGQLQSIANSASFNGENWLAVNSAMPGYNATKSVVASFSRDTTGAISIGTITVNSALTKLYDSNNQSGILDTVNGTTNMSVATLNVAGLTDSAADQTTLSQLTTQVDTAIQSITSAAATLGATQTRINLQATFVSSLSDAITSGVGSLVDADMNQASTKLQALQTQQQLGIQSLSIANQNSQLILKLFGG